MLSHILKRLFSILAFHRRGYLYHNEKRLQHLASLNLNLRGKVLEVGAGIGDHTPFFLERGCDVTVTEGRTENVVLLHKKYPLLDVRQLNWETPFFEESEAFDVVYCYGLLYHLGNPIPAIRTMGKICRGLLLLETAVSPGVGESLNTVSERKFDPTQALSGNGCRPTREWVFRQLKEVFPFVYISKTQPNHQEFPLDWSNPKSHGRMTRAIFIASKNQIDNPLLSTDPTFNEHVRFTGSDPCRYRKY